MTQKVGRHKEDNSQIRERFRELCFAAGLQHVAVRDDHAVEVPFEDFRDGFARGFAVAYHQSNEAMRSEAAAAADQRIEEACVFEIRGDVEDQIGENRGAGWAMEKHHFVQTGRTFEEMLIDL